MQATYLHIWFWDSPNKYILHAINNTGAVKCINLQNDMTYLFMYAQKHIHIDSQTRLMLNIKMKDLTLLYQKALKPIHSIKYN